MRVRHVSVRNFRGIGVLDWPVPDTNIICLIGRGDSTKSTVLEAIRRAFHPQWNLAFDDADFHKCDPENPIKIEVILGDLLDEFRDLGKYGHWLCGWDLKNLKREDDPGNGLEDALRVRLAVQSDLEPSWSVIKADDDEGVPFRPNDRLKAAVSLIGSFPDKHLTWSKGSVLSRLTEAENITASLVSAGRAVKSALELRRSQELANFDKVAGEAQKIAESLGVVVSSKYKAHLDSNALNVRLGGLALHDGELPLRQLGLGSKRMLATGLQKQALSASHITLFDELELGLEPHRIARLVHHLKSDLEGQYFLTTHSPVALRELTISDLFVVHSKDGKIEIVAANKPAIADVVQGKIREGAEAFLAPRIIVCEGTTEVGFLRGLDDYWISKDMKSFAYQGVAMFNANTASQVKATAESVNELGYSVCVLVDSDSSENFSETDAAALRSQSIAVAMWEGSVSIEERVVEDLPWEGVRLSCRVACRIHDKDKKKILDQIETQYGQGFVRDTNAWSDTPELRRAIGKAAKASNWFKRQSWAQQWCEEISEYFDDERIQKSDLIQKISALRKWIDSD